MLEMRSDTFCSSQQIRYSRSLKIECGWRKVTKPEGIRETAMNVLEKEKLMHVLAIIVNNRNTTIVQYLHRFEKWIDPFFAKRTKEWKKKGLNVNFFAKVSSSLHRVIRLKIQGMYSWTLSHSWSFFLFVLRQFLNDMHVFTWRARNLLHNAWPHYYPVSIKYFNMFWEENFVFEKWCKF